MLFENLYRKIRIKISQIVFCEMYLKKLRASPNYKYFLKHLGKNSYLKASFFRVSLYDVIDNNDFNKLIHRIYHLKRKYDLNVDTNYLLFRFRKVNYINSNLIGNHWGRIATITPKEDKWLHSIEIGYTYANNSQALIQFEFIFKKSMNTPLKIHQFIEDNIAYVKKEFYFFAYGKTESWDKADNRELLRLDETLFADVLQAYICTIFSTHYGKYYKLPIEYSCHIRNYNKKVQRKLRSAFLCAEYEKGNEHIVISSHSDRYEVYHFLAGKYYPNSILINYFSTFSSEMYFSAFSTIEVEELERRMRKYLNSSRSVISSKDIKWLVNKKRYIDEQAPRIERTLQPDNKKYISHLIEWNCFFQGKPQGRDIINYPEKTSYFLKLYEENLSYLNAISNVQNNKVLVFLAVATLIATIAGIIIQFII